MLILCSPIDEIKKHPSYHGKINQRQAEAILTQVDEHGNHFLTRYSRAKCSFMISARKGKTWSFIHKKVKTKVESEQIVYKICGTKRNSFSDLLEHLAARKLSWSSFRGIGKCVAGMSKQSAYHRP